MSILALPDTYATPVLLWATLKRDYPIAHDRTHFTVEGEYLQRKAQYDSAPPQLDTPCDQYPTAILVDSRPIKEEGDGVWFRNIYATKPADDASEFPTMSVVYPGLFGVRAPMPPRSIRCKLIKKYYIVGSAEVPTIDDLPQIPQTKLTFDGTEIGFLLSGNLITRDSFTVRTGGDNPGVEARPFEIGGIINNAMGIDDAPNGALTAYLAMIASDAAEPDSYSIVVEEARPVRYMGNIWCVEHIVAKAL